MRWAGQGFQEGVLGATARESQALGPKDDGRQGVEDFRLESDRVIDVGRVLSATEIGKARRHDDPRAAYARYAIQSQRRDRPGIFVDGEVQSLRCVSQRQGVDGRGQGAGIVGEQRAAQDDIERMPVRDTVDEQRVPAEVLNPDFVVRVRIVAVDRVHLLGLPALPLFVDIACCDVVLDLAKRA